MAHFDRWDIIDAYAAYHYNYSVAGYATGRREAWIGQTHSDIMIRLRGHGYNARNLPRRPQDLSKNGKAIYKRLVQLPRAAMSAADVTANR